jgi:hypothetical protein
MNGLMWTQWRNIITNFIVPTSEYKFNKFMDTYERRSVPLPSEFVHVTSAHSEFFCAI